MRRREFITFLGGAAVAWPDVVWSQQGMPVIGFLNAASPDPYAHLVRAFHQGLSEVGFVEGKTVAIEYRWAEGQYDRLPAMAADLASRRVTVITALAGPATLAAKAATTTIPIVFYSGSDPVEDGIVESLHHPGGKLTGLSAFFGRLNPKRVQLLHQLLPGAKTFGL